MKIVYENICKTTQKYRYMFRLLGDTVRRVNRKFLTHRYDKKELIFEYIIINIECICLNFKLINIIMHQ